MVDALKKIDKKFLIIFALIIIVPLFLIIILALLQSCGARKLTFTQYEDKMVSSAKRYFNDNNLLPQNEGEIVTVELSKLVDEGYIKNSKSAIGDENCVGFVTVRRTGSSIEKTNGGYLNYLYDLTCDAQKTEHLIDKLKEDLVTEGSGLYESNGEYIYKGKNVNNNFTIDGENYKVLNITSNGLITLIKSTAERTTVIWDDKYNSSVSDYYGINNYKESLILETLNNYYYENVSSNTKPHIVAADTCIGKRAVGDNRISKEIDCSERLENQLISLINVSDYALASLDGECNSVESFSCDNYNYLFGINLSTWTPNASSDDSYSAYYVSLVNYKAEKTSTRLSYNVVIRIDGNELYTTGNGSLENPYVIK